LIALQQKKAEIGSLFTTARKNKAARESPTCIYLTLPPLTQLLGSPTSRVYRKLNQVSRSSLNPARSTAKKDLSSEKLLLS
jgi:hypothetical protein